MERLLVRCLLTLDGSSAVGALSMTALRASCIMDLDFCSSLLSLFSESTTMTFLTRPPRVAISALTGRSLRAFKALMMSEKRSGLSSQQSETLTKFPPSSSAESTVNSSVSVGTGVSSAISVVCLFSSLTWWITSAKREALSVWRNQTSKNQRTLKERR